jgi:multidrug transporter EmrE-like cation transporter
VSTYRSCDSPRASYSPWWNTLGLVAIAVAGWLLVGTSISLLTWLTLSPGRML